MIRRKFIILSFLIATFLPLSYVSAGTVLSTHKYAWSNNVGYINLENVIVNNNSLSGYAWSTNAGWIKFNPTNGGVLNDGQGHLSGFAWGEQLGWIDFNNVYINPSNGIFSGTATGTLAGIINFSCPTYCDVRTDWTSSTSTPVIPPSINGGGIPQPTSTQTTATSTATSTPESTPLHTDGYNSPLIIHPNYSSTFIQDVPSLDPVNIEMPGMNLGMDLILDVDVEPVATLDKLIIPENVDIVGGFVYNILLKYMNGTVVHSLPAPITITLPLPEEFVGSKKLAVYWLNETNQQWVLIPEAVFYGNKATFRVDHLTRFSIIRPLIGGSQVGNKYPAESFPISLDQKKENVESPASQKTQKTIIEKTKTFINWTLIFSVITIIILYVLFRNKVWKREFFKPVI